MENEAFRVTISSVTYPKFLSDNQGVFNTTTIIINDPQSWFVIVTVHAIKFISRLCTSGLVGFIQNVYTVREDAGFMNLFIFVFNSSVDVEVNFTTFEQTAVEGITISST